MPNTPVEKVWFRKRDIVALHDLPSAQAHDPVIVNAHAGGEDGRRFHWSAKALAAMLVAIALIVGAFVLVIEQGWSDGFLYDRAKVALARVAGDDYRTDLGAAGVRLTSSGRLALEARDVSIAPVEGGRGANHADRVRLVLKPLALLTGSLEVDSVELSGLRLGAQSSGGFDFSNLSGLRIDAIEALVEEAFVGLDRVSRELVGRQTRVIRVSDVAFVGASGDIPFTISQATLAEAGDNRLEAEIMLTARGRDLVVTATADAHRGGGAITRIDGDVEGLSIDFTSGGIAERHFGATTALKLAFHAERANAAGGPVVTVRAAGEPGSVTLGGISADLQALDFGLSYIAGAKKIEVLPSVLKVGATTLPFTGGLIDIDRLPGAEGKGIAFDFVIDEGVAAPGDSQDAPVRFDAKAFGRILPGERRVVADQLAIAAGQESMLGSASFHLVEGMSPEVNLYAATDQMPTTVIKQLWPYWLGKKARQWTLSNLYGGKVLNGRIRLAIPAGHFPPDREADQLNENEFQIDFDVERTRMTVAGDIPPLRDTMGHFSLRGPRVSVAIAAATSYFQSGRKVEVEKGNFVIPETDGRPLMGEIELTVKGEADAVAELVTYRPIRALDAIDLAPGDLSGNVTGHISGTFGLIQDQNPPPAAWEARIELDGVTVGKPVEGRELADLKGTLTVTPERAVLETEALVDGAKMTLSVVEPVNNSTVKRVRKVSGKLDDKARESLAPGSGTVVSGPVGFSYEQTGPGEGGVEVDLKAATVTVPGVGWSKGKGIAAKAEFTLVADGADRSLKDFRFSGEGFEVAGDINLDGGVFTGARFPRMRLSPGDDYGVEVTRNGKGYVVKVSGKSADLRPLIASAKKTVAGKEGADAGSTRVEFSGDLSSVRGFYDEQLTSAQFRYVGVGAATRLLDFKAVTKSGQAAVMAVSGNTKGESVEITSGDAGAFARFTGVYGKLEGGLLNIRLSREGSAPRRGVVDVRNFTIVGEERLAAIVSTPAGNQGRSLSAAVNRDIDVSRARFELARANVEAGAGYLKAQDGLVRGPEIGAAFRGTIYDTAGNIDVAGTFMPAYGLNRIFGELPIIGAILGNGSDRGLIGITFRLIGKADGPKVEVNPLSIVAPGIFRQIFEYR